MSPYAHGCSPLCDDCLKEQLAQLRGVAQCRGEAWSRTIASVCPIDKRWPTSEKTRAIALRKTSDLMSDARLHELLAAECELGAARWNRALEQAG